jgi:TRAP-type C4-dicarboxylate transport system substrate-binding protein
MFRFFLILLACAATWLPGNAMAATFKIATVAPDGTAWMKKIRQAGEQITEQTQGRVTFRFYPGGVMGNDSSVLRKIRIGQLQGGAILAVGLTTISPDTSVYGLPFVFRSYAEVDYVRGKMDALMLADLKKRGFIAFSISEGGFAYMMSKYPVRTAADLKPRKVWIPEGDRISQAALESIGVSPIPLPLTDVLTGLQTGLIDTIGSSPVGAIALQWHTQVTHVTDAPLVYLYGALLIERRAFEKLSPQDQATMTKIMQTTLDDLNRETRRDNEKAMKALAGQGITILHATEEEQKRWQNSVDPAMDKLSRQGVFSQRMLQVLHQNLNDYRR